MTGHQYIVSGDPAMARNTVYSVLEEQGFKLTPRNDWSAYAERGSAGASVLLGGFAGKKGRHVKLDVNCNSDGQGNTIVTIIQGTSGVSGGAMGLHQANTIYGEIYTAVGTAYQNAGVLLSGGPV